MLYTEDTLIYTWIALKATTHRMSGKSKENNYYSKNQTVMQINSSLKQWQKVILN